MRAKYRRKKTEEGGDMIHWLKVGMIVFAALGTVFGSVWAASEYVQSFATKNELIIVQAQVQTALDQQMEDIMARIANLEAKPNKNQYDRDQIKYLRDQLERLRRIRSVK